MSYTHTSSTYSDEDLLFLPLGGTGEIGMNVNLYHYQGKWLMVDCGAGFANNIPGVDIIVADINFIENRSEDLVGIVITHIHEDHCGALPYLWEKLKAPIYCTQFTANFIKRKLLNKKSDIPINIIPLNSRFEVEPFKLEFINMTHSVPEMSAVAIHTDEGIIFHSGDWKIDKNPVVGEKTNFSRLKEIAQEGIIAMVCDSTNIFSPGKSESESILYEPLLKIVKDCDGAAVFTLFSSNIGRIETIGKVCADLNKTLAVFGRSLLEVITAAKQSGYLTDLEFIKGEEAAHYTKKDNLVILCTGCQGDELAAINKLSHNTYPYFSLRKKDTIIFSSKIIPGNEKRISSIVNRLIQMGVEVITEKSYKVHVSGHAYRDELKEIYDILKPNVLIPVHGEHVHLHEHAKFAKECGIKNALIPTDGDVMKITANNVEKINTIETGFYCIDNEQLQHPEGDIIKMRTKLQRSGLLMVIVIVNSRMKLLKDPILLNYGFSGDINKAQKMLTKLQDTLNISRDKSIKVVVNAARHLIKQAIPRNYKLPTIEVRVEKVTS